MKKWYTLALFNLLVLAILGLILRYKINFSLPFLEQKNLLHAHSHFAFNGWVSFLLQLVLLQGFTNNYTESKKKWDRFFLFSTFINYAMIASFSMVGYAAISIVFSTISLWLSYYFCYHLFKALAVNNVNTVSIKFVKAALFFLIFSSLGPYALAIIIAVKSSHQYWYHNALYFFLHFQYNGWFTFGVLALLFKKLEKSTNYNPAPAKAFYLLLVTTCIPAYLFTSLWHNRPIVITIIILITALLQTTALYFLWKLLRKNTTQVYTGLPLVCKSLYTIAILSFIIKILLQFFSVHPQLAKLAFGFRPVIIAYLHLIFLGFISMYLLSFITEKNILNPSKKYTIIALVMFSAGIIINELLLGMQGISAIYYLYFPSLNLLLFANTFIMVFGALLLFISSLYSSNKLPNPDTKIYL
ncbi:MAG: hypothetical protein V4717_11415 [Bacteroidota bacterium]